MLEIRPATYIDVPAVMPVIGAAKLIMRRSSNNSQWTNGYPSESVIESDISRNGGYVIEDEGRIMAYFAFLPAPEPTYENIYPDSSCEGESIVQDTLDKEEIIIKPYSANTGAWLNDDFYYVIHRLASLPEVHGVFDAVMKWAFSRCRTLRIDTHRDNRIMQHNLLKHGFAYCGIIYLASGDERMAFQLTRP